MGAIPRSVLSWQCWGALKYYQLTYVYVFLVYLFIHLRIHKCNHVHIRMYKCVWTQINRLSNLMNYILLRITWQRISYEINVLSHRVEYVTNPICLRRCLSFCIPWTYKRCVPALPWTNSTRMYWLLVDETGKWANVSRRRHQHYCKCWWYYY